MENIEKILEENSIDKDIFLKLSESFKDYPDININPKYNNIVGEINEKILTPSLNKSGFNNLNDQYSLNYISYDTKIPAPSRVMKILMNIPFATELNVISNIDIINIQYAFSVIHNTERLTRYDYDINMTIFDEIYENILDEIDCGVEVSVEDGITIELKNIEFVISEIMHHANIINNYKNNIKKNALPDRVEKILYLFNKANKSLQEVLKIYMVFDTYKSLTKDILNYLYEIIKRES